jgi:hypothetical protein
VRLKCFHGHKHPRQTVRVVKSASRRAGAKPWLEACSRFRPPEDRVPDFLTVLIARHDRKPPPGWQGVIELESKS